MSSAPPPADIVPHRALSNAPALCIAGKCPFPNTTLIKLLQIHGTSQFLPAIKFFIKIHFPNSITVPTAITTYNVFKQIKVLQRWNPLISDNVQYDCIRATPAKPAKGRKCTTPAKFDTTLVVKNEGLYGSRCDRHTLDGTY